MPWGRPSGNGRTHKYKANFQNLNTVIDTVLQKHLLSPVFFFFSFTKTFFKQHSTFSACTYQQTIAWTEIARMQEGKQNENTHTQIPQAVPHECIINTLVAPAHNKNSTIWPTTAFTRLESVNTQSSQISHFIGMAQSLWMHDDKENRETPFARIQQWAERQDASLHL